VVKILKLAFQYKEKLQQEYMKILCDERYRYYHCAPWINYDIEIKDSGWSCLQFVSVDKDNNVIGYFTANVDRVCEEASGLGIINFTGEYNLEFSRDLKLFINNLLTEFRKVSFAVVIGNPIEKMYDRYINKYNGRIVGIRKEEAKLQDGKYYDMKLYEIFKKDFIKE